MRPNPLDGDGGRVLGDIAALAASGMVDRALAIDLWELAAATPPPHATWIHGDLFPMNLLARRGKLSAVIDFDLMGIGDPAIDMLPAWALLTEKTRPLFREASGVDDNTWIRGHGYALCAALGALRKYQGTNHPLATAAPQTLTQVVAGYRHSA